MFTNQTESFVPTPETRRKLYVLLAELYPDKASAIRVAYDAGIPTALAALTDHALNNWHAILQEAEKQDRLAQLLAVVNDEYGANPRFRVIKLQFGGLPAALATLTVMGQQITSHPTLIGLILFGVLILSGVWVVGLPGRQWGQSAPDPSATPTVAAPSATPTPTPAPTLAPASFTYGVTVKDHTTGQPILNAKVLIEVEGKAPLDEYTDRNGFARMFVPAALAERPGRLTVEADGYVIELQNIDLWREQLPDEIRLTRQ